MHTCYSKKERFEQIESFLVTHQKGTMRQIAKAIKMQPGGHVMALLWQMQEDGILLASPTPYRKVGFEGGVRWVWSLMLYEPLKVIPKTPAKKRAEMVGV